MSRFICCEKQVVSVQELIFSTARSPQDGPHSKGSLWRTTLELLLQVYLNLFPTPVVSKIGMYKITLFHLKKILFKLTRLQYLVKNVKLFKLGDCQFLWATERVTRADGCAGSLPGKRLFWPCLDAVKQRPETGPHKYRQWRAGERPSLSVKASGQVMTYDK